MYTHMDVCTQPGTYSVRSETLQDTGSANKARDVLRVSLFPKEKLRKVPYAITQKGVSYLIICLVQERGMRFVH